MSNETDLDIADYESYLKHQLTPKRLIHSYGVMAKMKELAPVYGLDKRQAMIAGLLHDAAKELPVEQWTTLVCSARVTLDDGPEYDYDHYLHGLVSAYLAHRDLAITDAEVLWAMMTHGYYGPWEQFNRPLGWCLRMADILEPSRDWSINHWVKDTVGLIREAVGTGYLTKAAILWTERLIAWFEGEGIAVHPNMRRVGAGDSFTVYEFACD